MREITSEELKNSDVVPHKKLNRLKCLFVKVIEPTFDIVCKTTNQTIAHLTVFDQTKPTIIFSFEPLAPNKKENDEVYVAEIGRIQITICNNSEINIYKVREKYRNIGVGRILLEEAERMVKEAGYSTVFVSPSSAPYTGDSEISFDKLMEYYEYRKYNPVKMSDSTNTEIRGMVKMKKELL